MSQRIVLGLAGLGQVACLERMHAALAAAGEVILDCSDCARLPGLVIASAMGAAGEHPGRLRVEGLSPYPAQAIAIIDEHGTLRPDAGLSAPPLYDERPFSCQLDAQGGLHIHAIKGIVQHPLISEQQGHAWVRGLDLPKVQIDLAEVDHINSLLVAWLLQVCQAAAPAPVRLINLNRQTSTQLKQLRLNHLMEIP